ncbi:MAG TPA: trypsin-like serine protease [Micromonosporaceae bacterium]|nr:trypsin-like serine protease [Micromonosporaceae bacterium]
MALAASLTVGVAPAAAGRTPSPEAPTASDGTSVSVAAKATSHGESGFIGTGAPVDADATAPDGPSDPALGIESIYGADNRIRISPATSFPARAVVQITRNGAAHCSGWLYGKDIVATAGHCVHTGGSGGSWYSGLTIWPGRDGSSTPYGSCGVRRLHSVAGWTTDGNEAFDYGAIKLNCTIGNTTGWFGYWWQSATLAGFSTLINGYPGDKPFGQQWRGDSVARTVAVSQTSQIFYTNDTAGGMSGSAVYQFRASGSAFCTGQCSMAIHAYGFPHGAYPHNTYNHATRITEARFNNLQSWKNAA